MAVQKARRALTVVRRAAADRMPLENLQAVERTLAQLVARTFAAEHSHFFCPTKGQEEESNGSGLPAAAAAVSGAPPASVGGPELWSVEHDPDESKPNHS